MPSKSNFFVLLFALAAMIFCPRALAAQTQLNICNSTKHPILVFVNVPPTSNLGCGPTAITELTAMSVSKHPATISITQAGGSPQNGMFTLEGRQTAVIGTTSGFSCLDTVGFTFLAQAQCPCLHTASAPFPQCGLPAGINLPDGTNTAEVVLNPPSKDNESIDISCINGANSSMQFSMSGGPKWTSTGSDNITQFANASVEISHHGICISDGNCNKAGVYPYNLTNCTAGPGNGCAVSQSSPCGPRTASCQVSRAAGKSGGTVTVNYLGPITSLASH
jgi:hypothetical protein